MQPYKESLDPSSGDILPRQRPRKHLHPEVLLLFAYKGPGPILTHHETFYDS